MRLRVLRWYVSALTGWGRQGDIDNAHAAGFDGHLLKPVEADAMISLIQRLRAPKQ
jgi:two-component system CheB/CheR fusion protein